MVFVVSRARVVSVPFERDEGEYAYIAQGLPLGEVPYRDAFLQKTPGVVFVYAGVFAVFGASIEAVHGVAFAVSAVTVAMLFALVRRLADAASAALAALIFVVVSVEPRLLATSANTEHFGLCAVTASILAALHARGTGNLRWWFASGAAVAAAVACKQVAAAPAAMAVVSAAISGLGTFFGAGDPGSGCRVHGPGFGVQGSWRPDQETGCERTAGIGQSMSRILRSSAVFLLGMAFVLVPLAAYIVANGVWDEFLDCAIVHNLDYGRRVTLSKGWENLTFALGNQWPVMTVAWALALLGIVRSGLPPCGAAVVSGAAAKSEPASTHAHTTGRGRAVFWLAWLGLSFMAICAALNFYEHYFVWWLAPLAGAGGVGGGWLLGRARRIGAPAGMSAAVSLVAMLTVPTLAFNGDVWLARDSGRMASQLYGANVFAESPALARLIRDGSEPQERVLILGTEPQILFHAGRRSVTRYIIMYPLFGPYADALGRQQEVMTDVAADPPRWIVDVRLPNSRTPHPDRPLDLERFVASLLMEGHGYVLEGLAEPKWKERRFALLFGGEARERVARGGIPEAGVLLYRRD